MEEELHITNLAELGEYLKGKIKSVNKCYEELVEPYTDKKLNIINTSFMTRKEKEEFINKRNCLLLQKHCYQEILDKITLVGG